MNAEILSRARFHARKFSQTTASQFLKRQVEQGVFMKLLIFSFLALISISNSYAFDLDILKPTPTTTNLSCSQIEPHLNTGMYLLQIRETSDGQKEIDGDLAMKVKTINNLHYYEMSDTNNYIVIVFNEKLIKGKNTCVVSFAGGHEYNLSKVDGRNKIFQLDSMTDSEYKMIVSVL